MTWHQWHQTAPISSRMGLSSARARANASSPHSCHATGWRAADRRYGLAEFARRFELSWATGSFRLARREVPRRLLDGIIRAGVARLDRFACGKAFVLTVPEADALLAQAPAKIDFLVVDDGWKIQ